MDERFLETCIREVKMQARFSLAAFEGMQSELANAGNAFERQRQLSLQKNLETDRAISEFSTIGLDAPSLLLVTNHLRSQKEVSERLQREDGHTWPVFYFAYSFLLHCANLSKMLWPGATIHGKDKRKVGDRLSELKVIRQSRSGLLLHQLGIEHLELAMRSSDLSDDLEHYDERLEAWYVASDTRNVVDWNLMSRNAIQGIASTDMRRMLDPQSLVFGLENDDHDLAKFAEEVHLIHGLALSWLIRNSFQYRDQNVPISPNPRLTAAGS